MTEDQIIAEAVRLAESEAHESYLIYERAIARHALRLATQPEQDPALVKAMAVFSEARIVWECTTTVDCQDNQAAARKIMDAYPAPSAELLQWVRETLQGPCRAVEQRLAIYILTMAGEKQ